MKNQIKWMEEMLCDVIVKFFMMAFSSGCYDEEKTKELLKQDFHTQDLQKIAEICVKDRLTNLHTFLVSNSEHALREWKIQGESAAITHMMEHLSKLDEAPKEELNKVIVVKMDTNQFEEVNTRAFRTIREGNNIVFLFDATQEYSSLEEVLDNL